jgi:L-iditol 2-dehydrogenase
MMLKEGRIPNHVSLEAAAMLEPLSVAIHSTRRASIEAADNVIVFGAGTIGILTAAMAILSGATNVTISDIDAARVQFAVQNRFATNGFVVSIPDHGNTTEEKLEAARCLGNDAVEAAFSGCRDLIDEDLRGADVVFDCTGKEICIQAGLYVSSLPVRHQKLTGQLGSEAWRPTDHGWNGNADPDVANVCGAP